MSDAKQFNKNRYHITNSFSQDTGATGFTTARLLKQGYQSRQSTGVRISGFFDREGEDRNYMTSGQ